MLNKNDNNFAFDLSHFCTLLTYTAGLLYFHRPRFCNNVQYRPIRPRMTLKLITPICQMNNNIYSKQTMLLSLSNILAAFSLDVLCTMLKILFGFSWITCNWSVSYKWYVLKYIGINTAIHSSLVELSIQC